MHKLTLLIGILLLSLPAKAGDFDIRVNGKVRSSDLILVKGVWRKDLPQRLKVTLRAGEETPAQNIFFKAYFFNADGVLLGNEKEPNKVWSTTPQGIGEVGIPDPISASKPAIVFLALPEQLDELKTTVVLFGRKDGKLSYDIYPGGKKLEDLEFAEKNQILEAQGAKSGGVK